MVQTLQSFSQKLEAKHYSKKSFKVNLDNLKLSIDQLRKDWEELKIGGIYENEIFEEDIYQSPYEDVEFEFMLSTEDDDEYLNEMVGINLQK